MWIARRKTVQKLGKSIFRLPEKSKKLSLRAVATLRRSNLLTMENGIAKMFFRQPETIIQNKNDLNFKSFFNAQNLFRLPEKIYLPDNSAIRSIIFFSCICASAFSLSISIKAAWSFKFIRNIFLIILLTFS